MSQLFPSSGQRFGASASTSVLLKNTQDQFPLRKTDLISLQSEGLSRVLSNITVKSINYLVLIFFIVQLSHPYMTTGKTIALTRWTFVSKMISLLFNMLSQFVTAFLPRSKHFLISWLKSPSAVILEPKKIKSVAVSFFLHLFAMKLLFTFCHQGGVIFISNVIDISSSNLNSNLCFIQPGISHDVLCI